MGAVEDANLALFVGGHVRHHRAVQTGGLEGQLLLQPCRAFDVPNAEDLAHIQQGVGIAVLLLQTGNLLRVTDAAGNNPVHQRGAEGAVLIDVLAEVLAESPLVNVLVHTAQQLLAVVVDQLAGEDHQSGAACVKALQQNLSQLAGEGAGRSVCKLAGGVVDNACLGGVGHDVFQILGTGKLHHGVKVSALIGVQAAGDAGDDPLAVNLLAVLPASEVQRVKSLLLVNQGGQSGCDGLYQNALAVPAHTLVGDIEPVVHEGSQEVALAKLHDLLRCALQNVAVIAGLLQYLVI